MKKLVLAAITLVYLNSSTALSGSTLQACTVHDAIYKVIPLAVECVFTYSTNETSIQGGDPLPDINNVPFTMPPTDIHARLEPHNPECFGSYPL